MGATDSVRLYLAATILQSATNVPLSAAEFTLEESAGLGDLGWAVGSIGDFDDDGVPDFGATAWGWADTAVAVFVPGVDALALTSAEVADFPSRFEKPATTTGADHDWMGILNVGDWDSDGRDEVVVVGSYHVWGFSGAGLVNGGPWSEAEATWSFTSNPNQLRHGRSVDLDNDGLNDLVLGSRNGCGNRTYVLLSASVGAALPTGGTMPLANADFVFDGAAPCDDSGWAISPGGDIDGDGTPDLLIGAPELAGSFYGDGSVFVLLGAPFGG